MRSIGYAAAVAAGLIVPVAFILPASAGAQSLALSGVSSFVDSSDSDDDDASGPASDDSEIDETGNESVPGDADPGTDPEADRIDDLQPDVTVYAAGLSSSGDVAFVVRVSDVGAFDVVTLSSPAMDSGCALNNLTGATSLADRFGNAVFSAQAASCIPGTYKIAVTEPGEATYYGDVTVY